MPGSANTLEDRLGQRDHRAAPASAMAPSTRSLLLPHNQLSPWQPLSVGSVLNTNWLWLSVCYSPRLSITFGSPTRMHRAHHPHLDTATAFNIRLCVSTVLTKEEQHDSKCLRCSCCESDLIFNVSSRWSLTS